MPINHANLPSVRDAPLPVRYEAAKAAIREADRIDECKEWSDRAAALASYAKQADDKDLLNIALRIRARASRRCGQILDEMEKAHGANQNISGDTPTNVPTRKDAATQAGLSKDQAVNAIRVARVPEEEFEEQVESNDPPTLTALADQGTRKRKEIFNPFLESGLTKGQFQASMHAGGAIRDFARKAPKQYPLDDVVVGIRYEYDGDIHADVETIKDYLDSILERL